MRNVIVWMMTLLVLVVVNVQIVRKEHLLKHGEIMLLRLAPRDPRSILQGDYMQLRYDLPAWLNSETLPRDGKVVVCLDEHQTANILRRYNPDEPLAEGEFLLRYRRREGRVQLGASAFFFQEGHAKYYANARYGELRVDSDGDSVLAGLRDDEFNPLEPRR